MATSHICATIYRITLPFERAYLAYFALLTTVKNALFSGVSQEALSYEINQNLEVIKEKDFEILKC